MTTRIPVFSRMTALQRSIVAFHFVDRMSHAQVARALDLTASDYAREWSQARARIADYFATTRARS